MEKVNSSKSTKAKRDKDREVQEKNKKVLKLQGKIVGVLPGTKFEVEIDHKSGSHVIIGYISGKMRMYYIKLQKGDIVDLEVSPYDLTKGRITYRYK